MPGFDGTGPMGQGAMTGGGRGYCAVALNSVGGRPFGGRGSYGRGGRGFRNCFYTTGLPGWMRSQRGSQAFGSFGRVLSKDDELLLFRYLMDTPPSSEVLYPLFRESSVAELKNQADYIKGDLEAIQGRIQELEGK